MVPEAPSHQADLVYGGLLKHALREIASPAATLEQRIAWARIAAYVLAFLPETEDRVGNVLSTASKVLDSTEVVSRLCSGLWRCTQDEPRMLRWFIDLADEAIRGGHWATFADSAHAAVCLDGFTAGLSPTWAGAFVNATADPSARVSAGMFAIRYLARFPLAGSAPPWLEAIRDSGGLNAAFDAESMKTNSRCPICGMVQHS